MQSKRERKSKTIHDAKMLDFNDSESPRQPLQPIQHNSPVSRTRVRNEGARLKQLASVKCLRAPIYAKNWRGNVLHRDAFMFSL